MVFDTLKWIGDADGHLELTDQRKLPGEYVKLNCTDTEQLFDAIKTLAVRGAPAIGVAAGYGVCLGMQSLKDNATMPQAIRQLDKCVEYLAQSRPTAVNLFWALERMRSKAKDFVAQNPQATVSDLRNQLLTEATAIYTQDRQMCQAIGVNGEPFIKENSAVLTHCNAGALATAGQGTALSPMYEAHKNGRNFKVYVDETRPLLQGARLTAWELTKNGIDATLICDNMAGALMKQGMIDAVITGADRIAANGDAANKIGTFTLSILAKHHNIPFYIAAPSSTFDLGLENGDQIPIELRDAQEVRSFGDSKVAPKDIPVYNPAFDVTSAANITAIITEKGVIEKPNTEKVSRHFAG